MAPSLAATKGPGQAPLWPAVLALGNVAKRPVLNVLSGTHFAADVTLGMGEFVHEYLAQGQGWRLSGFAVQSKTIEQRRVMRVAGSGRSRKSEARLAEHGDKDLCYADFGRQPVDNDRDAVATHNRRPAARQPFSLSVTYKGPQPTQTSTPPGLSCPWLSHILPSRPLTVRNMYLLPATTAADGAS